MLIGCSSSPKEPISCSDFTCFKEAAADCSNVKGSILTEVAMFAPIVMKSTQSYELIKEGSNCKLMVTQDAYEITTSDGSEIPEQMKEGYEAMQTAIIGKQGECIFTNEEMETLFAEWEQGTMSTDQTAGCTGELYSTQVIG